MTQHVFGSRDQPASGAQPGSWKLHRKQLQNPREAPHAVWESQCWGYSMLLTIWLKNAGYRCRTIWWPPIQDGVVSRDCYRMGTSKHCRARGVHLGIPWKNLSKTKNSQLGEHFLRYHRTRKWHEQWTVPSTGFSTSSIASASKQTRIPTKEWHKSSKMFKRKPIGPHLL